MNAIKRVARILWAAWKGESHLWLRTQDREGAACDLSDVELSKWSRWALTAANRAYVDEAKRKDRSLQEVVVMHGVISLALLTLKANAKRSAFTVNGVTFRGEEKGDWRVTIERIAPPHSTKADSDGGGA